MDLSEDLVMTTVQSLKDVDASTIIDALYVLGSSGQDAVTPEILGMLIQLIDFNEQLLIHHCLEKSTIRSGS